MHEECSTGHMECMMDAGQDIQYTVHDIYITQRIQCMMDVRTYAVHDEGRIGHMQGMTDAIQDICSA